MGVVPGADGTQQIVEPDAVKLGYYVQVFGNVGGNGSASQPGVYVNHNAVALAGYGPEISVGLDTASVGFGAGVVLPAGASAAPVAAMAMPAAPAVGLPVPPVAVAPAPTFVAAAPAFLAPAMPQPPAVPAAPPVPAEPALTPAGVAAGGTYAAFRQAGWNDAQLRASGFLA